MATLELTINEELTVSPVRRSRRLGLLFWSAIGWMLIVFALALFVPFLRSFYELSTPTVQTVVAWGAGTALGVGAMLGTLFVLC